jgi:Inorganic pyrophosphatase
LTILFNPSLRAVSSSSTLTAAFSLRRAMSGITQRFVGPANTFDYRVFFEKTGVPISSWHDIPLLASSPTASPQIFNMVVEIPRWSNAKQEISKSENYNPIKQDIKKGKLRFVRNCFPHHGYPFTYGAIPQVTQFLLFVSQLAYFLLIDLGRS